jgi:hypothetical protein
MLGQARVGDIVTAVCCCHADPTCRGVVGFFITGDTTVLTNNLGTVRAGDMAICTCGHPTLMVGFSPNVQISSRGAGRMSDPVAGCPVGVVVTGSGNVQLN